MKGDRPSGEVAEVKVRRCVGRLLLRWKKRVRGELLCEGDAPRDGEVEMPSNCDAGRPCTGHGN